MASSAPASERPRAQLPTPPSSVKLWALLALLVAASLASGVWGIRSRFNLADSGKGHPDRWIGWAAIQAGPESRRFAIGPFASGTTSHEEVETPGQFAALVCDVLRTRFEGAREVLVIGGNDRQRLRQSAAQVFESNAALAYERAIAVISAAHDGGCLDGLTLTPLVGGPTSPGWADRYDEPNEADRFVRLVEWSTPAHERSLELELVPAPRFAEQDGRATPRGVEGEREGN